jgi:hypothetical protein
LGGALTQRFFTLNRRVTFSSKSIELGIRLLSPERTVKFVQPTFNIMTEYDLPAAVFEHPLPIALGRSQRK